MAAQTVPCSRADPAQPGGVTSTYILCMGGAGIMHKLLPLSVQTKERSMLDLFCGKSFQQKVDFVHAETWSHAQTDALQCKSVFCRIEL